MSSKRDEIFEDGGSAVSDFKFDEQVAEVFDDMLERSVPFYRAQQAMVIEIGKRFHVPGTNVYDLGCSTATTLLNLASALDPTTRLIGYDNSPPMLQQAQLNVDERGFGERIELTNCDLNDESLSLENAGLVTMCWTLQFIRPLRREALIASIYGSLREGGAFVVTEKTLADSPDVNRFFIDAYYDLKRSNGYSETEIARKRESLENVLVPYSADENCELFRRNGFGVVETFFQWYNFVGFLCVKT